MCEPEYYSIRYSINPWMHVNSVDLTLAKQQWLNLKQVYESLGISVEVIRQQSHVPDMVFTADQGIMIDGKMIMSNFYYPQRQPESIAYSCWFQKQRIPMHRLPSSMTFEGEGDCLLMGPCLFVGTGFRTTKSAIQYLRYLFPEKHVISLELTNPFFYHADTCFFPLDESVAWYYPAAFSDYTIQKLNLLFPNLFAFSQNEATALAANSIVFGKYVITPRVPDSFHRQLRNFGYNPLAVDVSEFIKAGGAVHCLTKKLILNNEKQHVIN